MKYLTDFERVSSLIWTNRCQVKDFLAKKTREYKLKQNQGLREGKYIYVQNIAQIAKQL